VTDNLTLSKDKKRRYPADIPTGKTMFKNLTKYFHTPSAETLAQQELEEARRELLITRSSAEYAARMVDYHTGRIKRLNLYLEEHAA
jgi:hypothetical protein